MGSQKTFRRGEQVFREGERSGSSYIILSGMVTVYLAKQKKNIELYRATAGQIIGEEALFGLPCAVSATAVNETVVQEIPAARTKAVIDASDPTITELFKAVIEKQKSFTSELKTIKAEQDNTPCPPDNIAKVFACLYHVANYYGEKKDNTVVIQWSTLKRLAQRLFLESPIRLEQAFNIAIKLKLAEVKMVKSDTDKDAIEEMGPCTFHDLKPIERFFEFYQNYQFKGGASQILKYDEKCQQTATAMVKISENERMDKSGVVYMNYKAVCDSLKGILGPSFNPDQIMRLETKGLLIKRQSSATGGTLSFIRSEFLGMIEAWRVLNEVEKWNALGFVDMKEPKAVPVPGAPGLAGVEQLDPNAPILTCTVCLSQITATSKFCSACGEKVEKAA